MSRHHRVFVPGTTQHVIQRGNNRADIFREPPDYEVFLHALCEGIARFRVDLHGYVLMTNHVHLMVSAQVAGSISRVMQSVGRRYVLYFNRRYCRTGGLFEGRYRSFIVDTEAYWYTCMRYVERNPVRAGLATSAAGYRWSSFRANGLGRPDILVVPHALYLGLGSSALERQRAWCTLCEFEESAQDLSDIRRAIRGGGTASDATLSSSGSSNLSRPVTGV